ncbi:enolase C-terminal domain-like protein [Bordetella sp. BOR01]|uniref:enolase C-terminal domain-like protein n=1 Tax=Bordetella sp. BOR01 TaxID=2854779 RepID=UPI001C48981E|nr:enolase C-terminal domain-like protein [Bordetella sp. BOR01]MBV7483479.1 mandelate racemase [Bordetella sp. BOR01]
MSDLHVTSVQARAVLVPLEHPVRTSVGVVDKAPLVLIDLHTPDKNIVGRSYLFTYTPLALLPTCLLVRQLGQVLERQPLAPADLDRLLSSRLRLLGRTGLAGMACAGLDMAAWDALAVSHGQPLARLLGGSLAPVQAYDSHAMDGIDLGVRRAAVSMEQGFRAIKTKIGYPSIDEDLRVLRALRKVVGYGVAIMADYNQGLNTAEAGQRLHALRDERLAWIEEPTLQEDYAGHARLRAQSHIPVQMGENWCSVDEMHKALLAGACDLAMPDIMKIGGVTAWQRASALAQAHGIPVSSHIFQEFSAHMLAVTPGAHYLERMDLAAPILREALVFRDGCAQIGDAPGVGLAWDEDAVERYAVAG